MKKLLIFFSAFLAVSTAHATSCEDAAQAYQHRLDDKEARRSLELYEQLASTGSAESCPDAHVKAAKAAWWVADHSTSKKEKMATFQKGIDFSKEAVRLNPNSAAAHFWLAGNYGSFGEVKGVLKSLALVKPIRQELNEVMRLDPAYDEGAAYRVLGVVDYKVPGFAGGNKKRAEDQLKKSLEMGPQNPFNLYYLAEYYETVGKDGEAALYLDRLDALDPTDVETPDWTMMHEKGKVLRSKFKKK